MPHIQPISLGSRTKRFVHLRALDQSSLIPSSRNQRTEPTVTGSGQATGPVAGVAAAGRHARRRTPKSSSLGVIGIVLMAAGGAFSVLQSLVVPVLAEISTRYDADQATTSWVVTAYLISAAVCTPLLGRIGDSVGKRRTLTFSLGALAIGSLIAGLAPSIEVLIAARVLQGVGSGVLPLSFGIVRDEFPPERVAQVVSTMASMGALGFAFGVAVGGPMVDALGFRSLFFVPAAATAVTAVATVLFVPESPKRPKQPLSPLPAVLLAAWLTALLLPISKGAAWGWTSVPTIALLGCGGLLLLGWVVAERRAKSPIIDLEMMRLRPIWSANVLSIVLGFAMFSGLALVPQLLQTPVASGYGLGASVTASGVALVPCGLSTFVAGMVSIRVTRRVGLRRALAFSLCLWAAAMFAMARHVDSTIVLSASMAVMGIGLGIIMAALAAAVVDAAPAHQTGAASGMHANVRQLGGAAGAAITSAIVTAAPVAGYSASAHGYSAGFLVIGIVLLASSPLALLLPRRSASLTDPRRVDRVAEIGLVE